MFSFANLADLFSLVLTIATLVTGVIFVADKYFWQKRRNQASQEEKREPNNWIAQARSVFPVLLAVFVLRSFIIEPFQIPSGSMQPTLLPGDFITVEKFAYGLRDPIFHHTFFHTEEPKRGDVVVFVSPKNPKIDLIKRIVGLPGDTIIYRNKTLYIKPACDANSKCTPVHEITKRYIGPTQFTELGTQLDEYQEKLGAVNHKILRDPLMPEQYLSYYQQSHSQIGEWVVPKGHYFAMGDNRDNSDDSRYWGFVPESNLIGKANFVWMSFSFQHSRGSWLPHWIPSKVRLSRIGEIG